MQPPNRPVIERFAEYCLDVGRDALMIDNALTFGARGRRGQRQGAQDSRRHKICKSKY
jgi:hypothetical protein